MTKEIKKAWLFIAERRASFTFTIGSIAYGIFHLINPSFIGALDVYEPLDIVFQAFGGRFLGSLFVLLGVLKLVGIITDKVYLKLPLYFALLFLWLLLSITLFTSFIGGNANSMWICTSMVALLSTNIIKTDTWSDANG